MIFILWKAIRPHFQFKTVYIFTVLGHLKDLYTFPAGRPTGWLRQNKSHDWLKLETSGEASPCRIRIDNFRMRFTKVHMTSCLDSLIFIMLHFSIKQPACCPTIYPVPSDWYLPKVSLSMGGKKQSLPTAPFVKISIKTGGSFTTD